MLREIDVYDLVVAGPSALRGAEREARRDYKIYNLKFKQKYIFWISNKNGGKIWILRDPHKRYFERPKKVHFWKIHFQNLLQKSKNSNFAAIFIYMAFMD